MKRIATIALIGLLVAAVISNAARTIHRVHTLEATNDSLTYQVNNLIDENIELHAMLDECGQ